MYSSASGARTAPLQIRAIMPRSLNAMAIADQPLSISDAARVTGLSAHTLRYYERAGAGNEPERLAILEAHRREVLAHLDETRRNLEAIERKVRYYREAANASTPVSSADSAHSRAASSGSTA